MIALFLGTSEGKKILSLLNTFTEDIFISTATSYGGELLRDYKYKVLNTAPLDKVALAKAFKENNITVVVDGSHPYATEITKTLMNLCTEHNIDYIRYERPSVIDKFKNHKEIIRICGYEQLLEMAKNIKGTILNTTGSRNIKKLMDLGMENRIVHRVLPSIEVMQEYFSLGLAVEDIIAIKGPTSYDLNCSFIKEYEAEAIILKDSGVQGGTEEKLKAAIDLGITAFVIDRSVVTYENSFNNEDELVEYIRKTYWRG
ncbi:cobalt-precorrin-6A reductase [Clostridium sp.]|uniref:cobalt-precorrin-6A reductase n=1 Tax=Clostridium sp. TaxID=1506 RepID=UPI001A531BD8|nr:cobalt-precorrin-6A reductase [Clostridium sp.]MBK5242656.1 cobalt-precorrin-6A reductase [Clostridium sp.]